MNIYPNPSEYIAPRSATLAVTYDATVSSDTTVTLNAKTAVIIVTAELKGIFMRWDAAATSSAFDEYIPAGGQNIYVRPAGAVEAHFIEEAASAHLIVIEK